MEMTDEEVHLLARLSRDRGLYAECKGAELDCIYKSSVYYNGLTRVRRLRRFQTRSPSTTEIAWHQ